MTILCNDLNFRELQQADLEALRGWRNSDYVRSTMQDQSLISSEAQVRWYQRISQGNHWYFVVERNREAIGVANLKDIDPEQGRAEAGLFMIREEYANGVYPMTCSAVLLHLAFDCLMLDELQSASLKSNPQAGLFNQSLGFQRIGEDERIIRWVIPAGEGRQSRDRILALLASYHRSAQPVLVAVSGKPAVPINSKLD
jgi:RimJ/RimL family protein N-acetyltransferase